MIEAVAVICMCSLSFILGMAFNELSNELSKQKNAFRFPPPAAPEPPRPVLTLDAKEVARLIAPHIKVVVINRFVTEDGAELDVPSTPTRH